MVDNETWKCAVSWSVVFNKSTRYHNNNTTFSILLNLNRMVNLQDNKEKPETMDFKSEKKPWF